jgi:hypothetical protein
VDLQLRRVPRALRDKLRKRASSKGMSMSKYAVQVLAEGVERPTLDEWLSMVRSDPPVVIGPSAAELIREARHEVDAKFERVWSSSTRRRR